MTTLLERFEALHKLATERPWQQQPLWPKSVTAWEHTYVIPRDENDAKLIVTLRNSLPEIIALVRAADEIKTRIDLVGPGAVEDAAECDGLSDAWHELSKRLEPFTGERDG